MTQRLYDYLPLPEYIAMNQIATIGGWVAGWSYIIMIVNFLKNAGKGKEADMRDPFKIGEEYYDYARREPHH
jgi:cytochrome c oxidase subunit 1